MRSIPVAAPWITETEISYVTDAARTAWRERAYVYHERFERDFATYTGRAHAIALPSCTSALHLALAALGIGPGDEVIVPDATWIASSAPVSYVGATPVFAEVEPDSWCLSPTSFEACIGPRTRAVIVVDLYGNMPDMDAVLEVAEHCKIEVIEDAAEALGSEYRGRRAGGFGAASTFSFHGSKTLTTGEGGMLVTDCDDLHERALRLRDHGRPPGDRHFRNDEVAFKYKMSSLQAALGLAQLHRVEELVAAKRRIAHSYMERLEPRGDLSLNSEASGVKSTFWMVTALLPTDAPIDRDAVMTSLRERGIDTRPFFRPLSSLPAYVGSPDSIRARRENRVAYELAPRGINLPSGPDIEEVDIERVCEALDEVLSVTPPASGVGPPT